MENIYETIIILKPDMIDSEAIVNKLIAGIQEFSPYKINKDILGEKKLAYEMSSYETGYYVVLHYKTIPDNIQQIEKQLRINLDVLKFLTVQNNDADINFEVYTPDGKKSEQDENNKSKNKKPVDVFDLIFNIKGDDDNGIQK